MQASQFALTMSEDDLQACVEDLLTRHHYVWFHDKDARRNPAGFLDIFAVHPDTGYLIIAELKVESETKGKLRSRQATMLKALLMHERPHFYVGVWRPRHWANGHIRHIIEGGAR